MKIYLIWQPKLFSWDAHGIAYDKVDGLRVVCEIEAMNLREAIAKAKKRGYKIPILTEKEDDARVDETKTYSHYRGRTAR